MIFAPSLLIAAAVSPVLAVTWFSATLVERTCSHSWACSGSVSDFDHDICTMFIAPVPSESTITPGTSRSIATP